ncbi:MULTISPECIES: ATPase [Rothia]|uniref:ATPase n=1 Tax=Rothia TaxID=32207 RepID=UPI0008A4564F|nr:MULTISPECIES: ATPase [Rothia]OFJ78715.1 ATPase [Rothia sp. HMSC069C10]OFQ74351.1 ATPase [Rothia sp. HMSC068E02]
MNTKFLLSPAYLVSVALMLSGAVLSGGRFMLIGWILCIVGVCLNAMTLVVLTNREQLYTMDAKAVRASRRGFDNRPAVVQRLDEVPATDDAGEEPAELTEGAAEEPAEALVEAPTQKTN